MNAGIFHNQIHANMIILACIGVFQNAPITVRDRSYISFLSLWQSSQTSAASLDPPVIVGWLQAAGNQKPRRERSNPEPESPTLPAFVKQAILFPSDSSSLDITSQDEFLQIVGWLHQHREVRVLVVGFCDPLGSENCTHSLAAQRGRELGRLLLAEGVDSSRILGMVGWEKADPVCRGETPSCQQQNRRVQVFVAVSPYAEDISSQKTPTKTASGKGVH